MATENAPTNLSELTSLLEGATKVKVAGKRDHAEFVECP